MGSGLFNNLPLIFAAAVALGMAKKAKEVAVLSSIIAFFVMHTTISGMLSLNGSILDNQIINPDVLDGTITAVCGIMSLEMGVFGGIIVGLGVSYIHNRFYQIELPRALSFFEGRTVYSDNFNNNFFVCGNRNVLCLVHSFKMVYMN